MVLTKETSLFKKDAIADDIGDAVASAVSVYMRKNASQTAPSKPTASTSIGTSPTTDGAWEYVMPYPKKNFKFYTCEQYTKVDGTKEYSDVRELSSETYISKWVHDADATYIDGGSLYTNSVTTDKIEAGAITIGKLSSDALYNVIYTVSTEHAVSEYPYIKLCTIQTVKAYQNKDVVFSISSRLSRMDTEINWAFNNSSSATASVVSHAYKTGATPVFYASEGNGKYGIYVSKADKYENLQVHDLYNPYPNGITIEWLGTEVTSLPSGYVAFTELAGSRPASDIDDAATKATYYITHIDNDGIRIHPSSTENNSVVINSGGMEVFKGGTTDEYSVAKYGDTARVGKKASRHIEISESGFDVRKNKVESLASIGYGTGAAESGSGPGPYYIFGSYLDVAQAPANYSISAGVYSEALGFCSRASGYYVQTNYANQTAIGKYNSNNSNNVFEIGWGTSSTPKNIFEVTNAGVVKANGVSISSTTRNSFTPTSGASYSGYGGCYYEKYGNVVHVHVGVSGLTANTATNIATLPAGFRPHSTVFAHGTGGSWNNLGYLEVTSAGVVTVRSAGTYCGADVTFIV